MIVEMLAGEDIHARLIVIGDDGRIYNYRDDAHQPALVFDRDHQQMIDTPTVLRNTSVRVVVPQQYASLSVVSPPGDRKSMPRPGTFSAEVLTDEQMEMITT